MKIGVAKQLERRDATYLFGSRGNLGARFGSAGLQQELAVRSGRHGTLGSVLAQGIEGIGMRRFERGPTQGRQTGHQDDPGIGPNETLGFDAVGGSLVSGLKQMRTE